MKEITKQIYLDYASTTPLAREVVSEMEAVMKGQSFGNPSSVDHLFGKQAHEAVEYARLEIASLINADADEIVWTSGATEANNLAILGLARFKKNGFKRHVISSFAEHKSVIEPCLQVKKEGFKLTLLNPNVNGSVDINELESVINEKTLLVSLMHVNNEVGSINDIKSIGNLCRKNNVFFHVDAAQGIGKLPIDIKDCNIDLMSLNAHKIYGPKGIGALFINNESVGRIEPILIGGGQERSLRPGTLATHQIAGMARAYKIAQEKMSSDQRHLRQCRELFIDTCQDISRLSVNGNSENVFPGILSVSIDGLHAESIIYGMKMVAVSKGSACNSDDDEPSHVLKAMGLSQSEINGTVRFSFGRDTDIKDVEYACSIYRDSVDHLHRLRGDKK